jgi:hypothetical protein
VPAFDFFHATMAFASTLEKSRRVALPIAPMAGAAALAGLRDPGETVGADIDR